MQLHEAVARTESADNQWAMRYEPHIHDRAKSGRFDDAVKRARTANRSSFATADVIVATSWGLYQIMGFNLYGQKIGLLKSVGEFMANRDAQREAFGKFIAPKYTADMEVPFDDPGWMMDFARFYNGPGAPAEYVAHMRKACLG